ncbi:hypothetical protein HYZ41_04895 [archaeon]|nr:hypothetical protein [archaeon]
MEKKTKLRIEEYIIVFAIIAALFFFTEGFKVTGFATASKGITADIGVTSVTNPNYGAIKGTLHFVIKDGDAVISTDKGYDFKLYFSTASITDYALVKTPSGTSFTGTLSGIDPDGTESVCSSSTFTTQKMYYDENNNNAKDSGEKDVYTIMTDSNGCFAAKIAPGSWDIYG